MQVSAAVCHTIRPTERVPHTNRRISAASQASRSPSTCGLYDFDVASSDIVLVVPAPSSQDPSLPPTLGALIPRAVSSTTEFVLPEGPCLGFTSWGPGWPFRGVARMIAWLPSYYYTQPTRGPRAMKVAVWGEGANRSDEIKQSRAR